MQIYLDHSATTPTRTEAIAAMHRVLTAEWGNPSSIHQWGERSSTAIEQARFQVAALLNANPDAIAFTSGGTEANNQAIMGVTNQYSTPQHVIISSVEHSSINAPVEWLATRGWQVTKLPVDRSGRIDPQDLARAIRPNTVLVSVISAQSEVGTIQPIAQLAAICRQHQICFHTDAVQAAGKVPIDVRALGIDLLSISSHKLYGPQGAGALYIRPGLELIPLLAGGGQEMGWRSGTQAVPQIAGFGVAAELASEELALENSRLIGLRDRCFELLANCPILVPTGDRWQRLPHHLSFCLHIPDRDTSASVTGKTIVRHLNLAGIGISSGAACASGKLTPSPILLAMGYSQTEAVSGIRLTLGKSTTVADIDWTAMVLKQILDRLVPQLVCA
ncbi:cysteine desulfurase family protein [Chamaesiphon sp. OTE_20_metabat_361]|uniref:cysteine desulfurase family protein n=1 Tax=Chamaesiphon sp. OTE_20_metabat_361 TaxID=2964689 RepID=UPI00286A3710|nr:cysteine desulfurase family protein [Chamaesiphon sp. OTE_20_metabat_361]